MKNLNEELSEIVHLASQAILADDEHVKRVALGDIYHAAANLLNRQTIKQSNNPPALVPTTVITHDEPDNSSAPRRTDRKTVHTDINYADGFVGRVERQGRKLEGVVDQGASGWCGYVYDGEDIILEVSSCLKGKVFVVQALRAAMYAALMRLTHMKRVRQNRKARRAAALSPDAELAATVARQNGDDDLAQRMENA